MSNFNVGDKIEIVFHAIKEYIGKRGKVAYIGASLTQGTDMLEKNIDVPDPELRFIVALNDGTIVSNMQESQLRKI